MAMRIFWVLCALVAFVVIDQILVYMADREIMASDAYIEQNYKKHSINFSIINKSDKPKCKFEYKYLIYGYLTCFNPITTPTNKADWVWEYRYHSPRPKLALFFRGDSPNDYYFQVGGTSIRVATILKNGSILEIFGKYETKIRTLEGSRHVKNRAVDTLND